MPRRSAVAAAASTPPKSRPLWPMCPMASMLGAPCWPLQCWTSAVNESFPPSPKTPRVPAWVAASDMEYVGLTLAIGEFSSQTDARSKSRAFCTFRMNSRTRPAPWDGSPAVAESTLPAAASPAARSAALRTKSRRATERGPSCALRLSFGMGFLPPGL